MADRIELFNVTVPALTAQANPQNTLLVYPEGTVTRAEILFPDGCSGLVGARLSYANVTLAPRTGEPFAKANAERLFWDLTGLPTGTQWRLTAFNSDIFPHTLSVTLFVDEFGAPPPAEEVGLPGQPSVSPGPSLPGEAPGVPEIPPEEIPPTPPPPPAPTPTPAPIPTEEEMPTLMINVKGTQDTYAIFPSGIRVKLGIMEFNFYKTHNVPLVVTAEARETHLLAAAAKVVTGGVTG